MRASLQLLTLLLLAAAPLAGAQTAVTQQAVSGAPAAQSGAAARPSGRPTSRHSRAHARAGSATAKRGAPAARADGVVNLGATDITGNKELPKVMVIVPWKRSPGAGGIVPPTDSLLDEVLGPVDRGVFQRQIRYYGQLNAAGRQPVAGQVAPVGDRQ